MLLPNIHTFDSRSYAFSVGMWVAVFATYPTALKAESPAFRAQGANLLTVTFPTGEGRPFVNLFSSEDGQAYQEAGIGYPRPYRLVMSLSRNGERMEARVVAAFRQQGELESLFLFPSPGTYHLRWRIGYEGADPHDLLIDQTVEVGDPLPADVAMLQDMGAVGTLKILLGDDIFSLLPGSDAYDVTEAELMPFRASLVYWRLMKGTRLYQTRDAVHGLGNREDVRRWGDTLLDLATSNPDSTYTPYVAYYAGCCFSHLAFSQALQTVRAERVRGIAKDRRAEAARSASLLRQDPHTAKAVKAFAIAERHADAYLRPRVLFQQAADHMLLGRLEEGEQLLKQVENAAPGDAIMEKWCAALRREFAVLRSSDDEGDAGAAGGARPGQRPS